MDLYRTPRTRTIAELYLSGEQDLVYPRQTLDWFENYDYDLPIELERVTGKSKSNLYAGGLFLRATLNEILQILKLCKELEEDHRDLLRDTTAQYDNLGRRKRELELLNKRKSIFRPLLFFAIKRAKRGFRDDAQALLVSTRTTSDRLKRNLISTSANLAPVESETVKGNRISGVVIPLPPQAEMNAPGIQEALAAVQEVASMLASSGNSSADSTSSSSQDGQSSTASALFDSEASSSARSSIATSPSSAPSFSLLNFNVNCNIINNTDSNAPGFTINNNSSETSGSSTTLEHQSSADRATS
ncbi:hypothetical protein L210DRAFT_3643154 [Boletus edulis BED1]|uniref:Uncharacterized protein n=1 Tax=Boletus edulis BED1 TaxID=1328754 RepID=A0AAD4GI25_BOLED|nr:hypothetical protein L210DRAFT_3643154 [Boletus edulis BED1]